MIERGQHLGFALESGQPIRIRRERLGKHLDRHVSVKVGVSGSIHLPHTAFADLGGDLIRAEGGAGLEGHDQSTGTNRFSSSNQFSTTMI